MFGSVWAVTTEQDCEAKYDPQVIVYSLVEDRMLMVYKISKDLCGPGKTVFTHLSIDTSRGPDKTMAIASDSGQFALLVLQFNQKELSMDAWRVFNPTLKSQPEFATFRYRNKETYLNFGVYGINIVPSLKKGEPAHLYYSSFAGNTLHKVPLKVLYSKALWTKGSDVIKIGSQKHTYFVQGKSDVDKTDPRNRDVDGCFTKLGQFPFVCSGAATIWTIRYYIVRIPQEML